MPPPIAPVPAEETATDLWDDSPLAAPFAVLSLVSVGILAFGAAHVLAPLVWHENAAGLGFVQAGLALLLAFAVGPLVILLLASAFRRLTAERQHRP